MYESTTLIKDNYIIKDTFTKRKLKLILQEIRNSILAVFILSIDIPSFRITENEFNHQYRHILCLSLSYVVSKLDNQMSMTCLIHPYRHTHYTYVCYYKSQPMDINLIT